MAQIVLGLGTSHSPLLSVPAELWPSYSERDKRNQSLFRVPDGKHVTYEDLLAEAAPAIQKELKPEKFQARHQANQEGIAQVAEALAKANLDVLLMFGDDQGEVFTQEAMPAVCVFWPDSVNFVRRSFGGDDPAMKAIMEAYRGSGPWEYPLSPDLGHRLVQSLNDQGFDVMHMRTMPPEARMSHAFGFVWRRVMDEHNLVPTVPIHVNTYYPPNAPTPQRCYDLGKAIRNAVAEWDDSLRVGVLGSGGFSHFVVDEELDRKTLKAMQEKDAATLCSLPVERMQAGTSEIRNWIATAGAVEDLDMQLFDYVPCYRMPAGTGCAMAFAQWS